MPLIVRMLGVDSVGDRAVPEWVMPALSSAASVVAIPGTPRSLLWFDAVLQRSNPVRRNPSAISYGARIRFPPNGDRPYSPGRSPGAPMGISMWQIARSADEMIAATGANNGAKLKRWPGPVAYAAAADVTRLSVNTSPVATRLKVRAGGVNRIAGDGVDVINGSAATTDVVMSASAASGSVDHVYRATHLVTPSRYSTPRRAIFAASPLGSAPIPDCRPLR